MSRRIFTVAGLRFPRYARARCDAQKSATSLLDFDANDVRNPEAGRKKRSEHQKGESDRHDSTDSGKAERFAGFQVGFEVRQNACPALFHPFLPGWYVVVQNRQPADGFHFLVFIHDSGRGRIGAHPPGLE